MAIYDNYSRNAIAGLGWHQKPAYFRPGANMRLVGLKDVTHDPNCPHFAENKTPSWPNTAHSNIYHDCTIHCDPTYVVETWAGCVLTTREHNYYDDSDFYAVIWDGEDIIHNTYATTRFGNPGYAEADATEEVKAQARVWLAADLADALMREEWNRANTLEMGRDMIVVKGRKVPLGTIGRVEWIGQDQWGHTRLRIQEANGNSHFITATNCKILNPLDHMKPLADIQRLADSTAQADRWAMAHYQPRPGTYFVP